MTKEQAKIKAKELVAKMTVEEKISQLLYTSAPIERLGIKAYNWWNEGAHGVARAGTATVAQVSVNVNDLAFHIYFPP